MSKTYEMIAESLNEIIQDLEKTGGKNLKRDIVSVKNHNEKVFDKKLYVDEEKFFEQTATL